MPTIITGTSDHPDVYITITPTLDLQLNTMANTTIERYSNLIKHIRNWPLYFLRKFRDGYGSLKFIIRKRKISFTTPAKSLYLVFKEIFVNDVYVMDRLAEQLPDKPTVIDIGSNAGYFSLFLLSRRPDTTIYAYDAVSANYRLFDQHLQMNPSIRYSVHAYHRAVTGTPQQSITLYLESEKGNSVTASVYNDFVSENVYKEEVPCISLKEIFEQHQIKKADLIKVDCEGSEYPIIYETPAEIWQQVDRMALEIHNLDAAERNMAYLRQYLAKFGFRFSENRLENDCYMLFAEKIKDAPGTA